MCLTLRMSCPALSTRIIATPGYDFQEGQGAAALARTQCLCCPGGCAAVLQGLSAS
jgi:hypothetical protein